MAGFLLQKIIGLIVLGAGIDKKVQVVYEPYASEDKNVWTLDDNYTVMGYLETLHTWPADLKIEEVVRI